MSSHLLAGLLFLICFLLALILAIWWMASFLKTEKAERITHSIKPLLILTACFPFITLLLTITHIIELTDATSGFYIFSFVAMPIPAIIASALLGRHYRSSYNILNAANIALMPILVFMAVIIYMFTDNNFSF